MASESEVEERASTFDEESQAERPTVRTSAKAAARAGRRKVCVRMGNSEFWAPSGVWGGGAGLCGCF